MPYPLPFPLTVEIFVSIELSAMPTTTDEIIRKLITHVTYEPEGHKFIRNGKDIKKKQSHGYYTVRVCIDGERLEAYAHHIIWYLGNGSFEPNKRIRFVDGNKDNLEFKNLFSTSSTVNARKDQNPMRSIKIAESDLDAALKLLDEHGIAYKKRELPKRNTVETPCEGLGVVCWSTDFLCVITG